MVENRTQDTTERATSSVATQMRGAARGSTAVYTFLGVPLMFDVWCLMLDTNQGQPGRSPHRLAPPRLEAMHAHNGLSLGGNARQTLLCSFAGSPVPVNYDVCNHRLRPRAAHCSARNKREARSHAPAQDTAGTPKAQHRRHGTYNHFLVSQTTKQENKPTAMRTNTAASQKFTHSMIFSPRP